jgi:hypothetical protein
MCSGCRHRLQQPAQHRAIELRRQAVHQHYVVASYAQADRLASPAGLAKAGARECVYGARVVVVLLDMLPDRPSSAAKAKAVPCAGAQGRPGRSGRIAGGQDDVSPWEADGPTARRERRLPPNRFRGSHPWRSGIHAAVTHREGETGGDLPRPRPGVHCGTIGPSYSSLASVRPLCGRQYSVRK